MPDEFGNRSDKGKKRKTYTLRVRAQRKLLNDLKRTQEDIERFERDLRKPELQKRRRVERYNRSNEKRREQQLSQIPADWRCRVCNEVKLKTKQWTIIKDGSAICKSCLTKMQNYIRDCGGVWSVFLIFAESRNMDWYDSESRHRTMLQYVNGQ